MLEVEETAVEARVVLDECSTAMGVDDTETTVESDEEDGVSLVVDDTMILVDVEGSAISMIA
jgi:hypothetical protein